MHEHHAENVEGKNKVKPQQRVCPGGFGRRRGSAIA